jgi:hypothetical protein
MPQVQTIQLVRYSVQVPGLLGAVINIDWPANSPPPVVTCSPSVLAANPGLIPIITVPERIPAKAPVTVRIHGKERTVPAAVARVLAEIEGGAREVELRPEVHAKFVAAVPEIALTRDHGRKVVDSRAWYIVG